MTQARPLDRRLNVETLFKMTSDNLEDRLRLAVVARRCNRKLYTCVSRHERWAQCMKWSETAAQTAHRIIIQTLEHSPIVQDYALIRTDDA